jgi:hypothetical protein
MIKTYIGAKIIQAEPMSEKEYNIWSGKATFKGDRPGYKVIYPGYVSWSPKDVFENAYREITQDERELV